MVLLIEVGSTFQRCCISFLIQKLSGSFCRLLRCVKGQWCCKILDAFYSCQVWFDDAVYKSINAQKKGFIKFILNIFSFKEQCRSLALTNFFVIQKLRNCM
jgi:hypothetical protein